MRYRAEGTFTTYISFSKDINLNIDRDTALFIPSDKPGTGINKKITIEGDYGKSEEDRERLDNQLKIILEKIGNLISFYFDSPTSSFNINKIWFEKEDGKNFSRISTTLTLRYNINTHDKSRNIFIKEFPMNMQNLDENNFIFSFYNKAISEPNAFAKFWYCYLLLQILTGIDQSRKMSQYIINNFKNTPTVTSDYYMRKGYKDFLVSSFVAIRDSFSHNAGTYNNGKRLDLIKEIDDNFGILRDIVKKTIKKRLNLK